MDNLPKRKQLRLKDYDYAQNGCYFVTICTYKRQNILSEIRRGGALLRPIGKIIEMEMYELQKRYGVEIDKYVVMPDHIHFIIRISRACNRAERCPVQRAEQSPAPTFTLGDMICAFKSLTTKIANCNDDCPGRKIWQRGYYEHIIRNEADYIQTVEYILNNPLKWELTKNQTP